MSTAVPTYFDVCLWLALTKNDHKQLSAESGNPCTVLYWWLELTILEQQRIHICLASTPALALDGLVVVMLLAAFCAVIKTLLAVEKYGLVNLKLCMGTKKDSARLGC